MGLPWIKVSVDLPTHPKLIHLESLLNGADGLAVIIRLWAWTAKYAPDGSFPAHLSVAVAKAVTRDGSDSHANVIEALITSGWIERGELLWIIHDWRSFQGALVNITEKNRKRQRKHRREARKAAGHANVTHDVTPMSRVEKRGEEKRGDQLTTLSNQDSTGVVLPLLSPPDKQPSPVEQVFAHWQKVMRKPRAVLDNKRRGLIKARLDEGRTVEEVCRAISGYLKSPHHMGQNEQGRKYDDITLICRDATRLEAFMPAALPTGPPVAKRKSAEEIAAEVNQEFEAKHGGI